jgi:hypothetical protein
VISFDNGYESQFNEAMPVLRRLHWVGVLNLQLSGLPRSQGGLSAEAIRRMLAAGWEPSNSSPQRSLSPRDGARSNRAARGRSQRAARRV